MDVKELAREFAENLAKTDAVVAFLAAKEKFENNQKLQGKMVEYNAQRTAIGAEMSKDVEEQDKLLLDRIRGRMNELYEEIAGEIKNGLLGEKRQKAYESKINQLKILYPVDKM